MPTKHNICGIAMAMLAAVVMAACEQPVVYSHYEPTPLSGWAHNDTVHFQIPKMKKTGASATDIGLRINTTYPFLSLSLVVDRTVFPSFTTYTDTLSCDLIDKKGQAKGQGLSVFQYLFPLSDINLNEGDSLAIEVRHDMRMELLPGISDIGIQLTSK